MVFSTNIYFGSLFQYRGGGATVVEEKTTLFAGAAKVTKHFQVIWFGS